MGKREFYGWVDQAHREQDGQHVDPDSWEAAEQDQWWQEARRRRDEARGW
jgi:hypothetical protein